MMKLLVDGHEGVARIARGIFPPANKASDESTADLLTQALRCASITLSTARRYVPSGAGPQRGPVCVSDRRLRGSEIWLANGKFLEAEFRQPDFLVR